MTISMTACGGNDTSSGTDNSGSGVKPSDGYITTEGSTGEDWHETFEERRPIDLDEAYNAIWAMQPEGTEQPKLTAHEKNSELVKRLYPDMERFDYEQYVLYAPDEIGYPCEIILVEATYKVDADHAQEVFVNRIENAAKAAAGTDNENAWVNRAEVQRDGFYVAMIVLPDGYEIPRNVFELID